MKTSTSSQIETTDYIHQTGMRSVSLKTITTELPADCIQTPSTVTTAEHEAWCADYLSAAHEYDVAMAEAKGRCAEGEIDWEGSLGRDGLKEILEYQAEVIGSTSPDYDSCIELYRSFAKALTTGLLILTA